MVFVELLSRFLHHYVVVCVALAIIPLKFLMVRLAKDRAGEVDTLLGIPEDLCYVTLGLLLSSLTADAAPLRAFFNGSQYVRTDGAILVFANFLLALFVHKISHHWAKPQYQTWRAALEVRVNNAPMTEPNGELTLLAGEDNLLYIVIHYFSKLLFSILIQLLFAGSWLYYVGRMYGAR